MPGQSYVWLVITSEVEKHFLRSNKEIEISRKTFTNKVDALKFCNSQRVKGYKSKIIKWDGR